MRVFGLEKFTHTGCKLSGHRNLEEINLIIEQISDVHRFNKIHNFTENTIGMILRGAHHRYPEDSALPFVLVVHFSNGDIKIIFHSGNNTFENLPLLFEGASFPQAQFNSAYSDNHAYTYLYSPHTG